MQDVMNGTPNILVVTSNTGVERDELLVPLQRLRERGARAVHAAPGKARVQTFVHDTDKDVTVDPDIDLSAASADDYDAVVIPGGTVNADKLRVEPKAVELVRAFAAAGKPVAAICHGPWLLVEAGLVDKQTLTSYFSLQTDIRNAGGHWTDQQVVESSENGRTLITSRNPGDLEAFSAAIAGATFGAMSAH
ncbi:type 1 glutamine amidotransferase domain-containing protein [Nocardia miyunensis]|uniref:type 1 glutamine amidotransferase domain-containing protein n=1 Tax=Nocardia miyunensis TaxID=282684 RepID=UPI00082BDB03|nr:type 1 glutamine amidotransferase domain-containing protein [Nocardia miyunensis]